MRTKKEFELVTKLFNDGLNKVQIYKITNIPRSTIKDWILKTKKPVYDKSSLLDKIIVNDFIYSYILGLYLGDGYINKTDRAYRIRIALDKKYLKLNEYAKKQLQIFFSDNSVGVVNAEGCINLSVYNKELLLLFPQHGIDRKSVV